MAKNDKSQTAADQLILEGTLTLSSTSREEIYKQAEELIANIPLGTKWTRTIVEHDPWAGTFTQTYSLIKD